MNKSAVSMALCGRFADTLECVPQPSCDNDTEQDAQKFCWRSTRAVRRWTASRISVVANAQFARFLS